MNGLLKYCLTQYQLYANVAVESRPMMVATSIQVAGLQAFVEAGEGKKVK
jgi:hypothetical protein